MRQEFIGKKYTYFISGGGTGGHIYPALAVLNKLLDDPKTKAIYYVGNPNNLEFELISKIDKVKFLPVKITAMPRKISFSMLKWLITFEFSLWKALFYIFKYKPDAIFATGGYVSAPITFAAVLAKKPFMIHDCDAHPGLVSRHIAPFANIVSVAFEKSKDYLDSNKIIVNGNPIRDSFSSYTKESARKELGLSDKITLLAMGGSQGAQTINNAVVALVSDLIKNKNIQFIIQTGKKNYEEFLNKLKELYPDYENDKNIIIKPYFDDMAVPLSASDIVIARAGSLSLSEINICALPSILVPYPYAAADHQRINAKEMCDKGASIYLEDDDCTKENLYKIIEDLLNNPDKIEGMSKCANSLARRNAVDSIIAQLKSIIK